MSFMSVFVAAARSLPFFLRGGKVKFHAVSIYLNMIIEVDVYHG